MARKVITHSPIEEDRTDEVGIFANNTSEKKLGKTDEGIDLDQLVDRWKDEGKSPRQISWNVYYYRRRPEILEKKRIKKPYEDVEMVDTMGLL